MAVIQSQTVTGQSSFAPTTTKTGAFSIPTTTGITAIARPTEGQLFPRGRN